MFTAPPEQTCRFDPEVSDLLFATVEETGRIRQLQIGDRFLHVLLLLRRHGFLLGLFSLEVFENGAEIAELEIRHLNTIALILCNFSFSENLD